MSLSVDASSEMDDLNVTVNEWPRDMSAAPYSIQPFWTCKEEISFASGLLFKVEKLIVQLRPQMLDKIHE